LCDSAWHSLPFLRELYSPPYPLPSAGGMRCLIVLDHLCKLGCKDVPIQDTSFADCSAVKGTADCAVPVDPAIRIATSFLSQLLCYTAIVPACDPQVARSLGGCSEMQPVFAGHDLCLRESRASSSRWRLWKLQREAVLLLLACSRSPVQPHVASAAVFIISGALQVSGILTTLYSLCRVICSASHPQNNYHLDCIQPPHSVTGCLTFLPRFFVERRADQADGAVTLPNAQRMAATMRIRPRCRGSLRTLCLGAPPR
jgi:hypothetical protein